MLEDQSRIHRAYYEPVTAFIVYSYQNEKALDDLK